MDAQEYLEQRHRQVEEIVAKAKDHRIAGWAAVVALFGTVGVAAFAVVLERPFDARNVFFWSFTVALGFYFLAYATFQQSRRRDAQAELTYLQAIRTGQAKLS